MRKGFYPLGLIALLCCGCMVQATIGDKRAAQSQAAGKIVPGKTTKKQVEEVLGPPKRVLFPDLVREEWTYTYDQAVNRFFFVGIAVDDASLKDTNVTIEFDGRGIVRRIGKGRLR